MALTKEEIELTRQMIAPEKAQYMAELASSDDFTREEIEKYKQKRLAETAVDLDVNEAQRSAILAERKLLL